MINTNKCRSELRLIKMLIEENGWQENPNVKVGDGELVWAGLHL